MVGRIIFLICCFMCSVPFLAMSGLSQDEATPIPFWSGSEAELKAELKDIQSYYLKMGKLYKRVAVAFAVCAVVGMIHMILGLAAFGCACTIGFYYVYRQYKIIKKESMD